MLVLELGLEEETAVRTGPLVWAAIVLGFSMAHQSRTSRSELKACDFQVLARVLASVVLRVMPCAITVRWVGCT